MVGFIPAKVHGNHLESDYSQYVCLETQSINYNIL